jgi:hypothetical protein
MVFAQPVSVRPQPLSRPNNLAAFVGFANFVRVAKNGPPAAVKAHRGFDFLDIASTPIEGGALPVLAYTLSNRRWPIQLQRKGYAKSITSRLGCELKKQKVEFRPAGQNDVCDGVESICGAVALGRTYLLPPLSSGGALVVQP